MIPFSRTFRPYPASQSYKKNGSLLNIEQDTDYDHINSKMKLLFVPTEAPLFLG